MSQQQQNILEILENIHSMYFKTERKSYSYSEALHNSGLQFMDVARGKAIYRARYHRRRSPKAMKHEARRCQA